MKNKLILGTRGSDLALWQTRRVAESLKSVFPGLAPEIKIIQTTGDAVLDTALSKIGDKGLFTRQIEDELICGKIDLAVHSLKDLPTTLPDGLKIGGVTEREIPNDAFISKKYQSIAELPPNAKVATGSLRRRSQLLAYRPDLQIVEIRGNVPTRIKKYEESGLDAMILAYAGVHRLNLDAHIKQTIGFEIMIPAVAQGVIGIEIRADDVETEELVNSITHEQTRICVTAERSFLRRLEGGCQVPIGGLAILENGVINLEGFTGSFDGDYVLRETITGNSSDAAALGRQLAERMIGRGANEILAETRREVRATAEYVI